MKGKVLVTGGAGYIGSHTVKRLLGKGYGVVIIDNLAGGNEKMVLSDNFARVDLKNRSALRNVFEKYSIEAVIHFAAHCRVKESVDDPQKYYLNNVSNGLNLLKVMLENDVKNLVFSSSAAVYGDPEEVPIPEDAPKDPESPYGRTKWFFEQILAEYSAAYEMNTVSLRYFNAAGSDPEGEVGEFHDPETHLIPIVLEVPRGKRDRVEIFGTDYETFDGTCIRDYIHVMDLADAHISALEGLMNYGDGVNKVYNLGTGKGHSVKEVIETCREVTGLDIPAKEAPRRAGDPPRLIADPSRAKEELDWEPEISSLKEIISTSWDWFKSNKL